MMILMGLSQPAQPVGDQYFNDVTSSVPIASHKADSEVPIPHEVCDIRTRFADTTANIAWDRLLGVRDSSPAILISYHCLRGLLLFKLFHPHALTMDTNAEIVCTIVTIH